MGLPPLAAQSVVPKPPTSIGAIGPKQTQPRSLLAVPQNGDQELVRSNADKWEPPVIYGTSSPNIVFRSTQTKHKRCTKTLTNPTGNCPGHIRPARIDLLIGELPGPYTAQVRGRPNPYLGSSPHFHRSGLSGRDVSLIVVEGDWHNVRFDWVDGAHQDMKITLDIIKVRITNFCKDRCWRTRFSKASLDHVSAMLHAGLHMTRSVPNVCQHIRNNGATQQLQSSLSSRPPEEPIIDTYPPTERKPGMPNPAASRDSKRCARGFRFEEGGLEASYVLAKHRATLIVVGPGRPEPSPDAPQIQGPAVLRTAA